MNDIRQYGLLNQTDKNKLHDLKDKTIKNNNNLSEQQKIFQNIEENIKKISNKIMKNNYENNIQKNYLNWINKVRSVLIEYLNKNNLYDFYKFNPKNKKLTHMIDYYDIKNTNKLFSFSLFILNHENLSYLIGLVYNYAIIQKHFKEYTMRIYIDFNSVFGSPETFNVFNMFLDILHSINPQYNKHVQMIVFFLNPYFNVNDETIYNSMVYDLDEVKMYYNNILYNTDNSYIISPLLNNQTSKSKINKTSNTYENIDIKNINININWEMLEITNIKINEKVEKSKFCTLSCHISVNLRFLPINENCEYHVRDLDSRLSQTDINIIEKFNNPKYEQVPIYVFQFYKYYFPYLKWRIDANPYLAGCFGGNNKKSVMISNYVLESGNMKILKKELFLKYILFLSFSATNLQIGFLNDEFILANIFDKIKGKYSENILYLNVGAFSNKHVNEYYYGINKSSNYPCMLKLGVPVNVLIYELKNGYVSIDPITDFKIGNILLEYHEDIKKIIVYELKKYLGYENCNNNNNQINDLVIKIRKNYNTHLNEYIKDKLEIALFFSMISKKYKFNNSNFDNISYTFNSYSDQYFSSIGSATNIILNENLQAINFMMAGYLLSDILENIIFPINPKYISSDDYINDENYDRLFNCIYFNEQTNNFIHKKINIEDLRKKNLNLDVINAIPFKYLEFTHKQNVIDELNNKFNSYLSESNYYPSMYYFIESLRFKNYLKFNNTLIESGLLIFVNNYENPIKDVNNNIISKINKFDVKTLKYLYSKNNLNNVKGINIKHNQLRFNVLLLDDENINQLIYQNNNKNDTINIKLIKNSHIENIISHIQNNKQNNLIITNNL